MAIARRVSTSEYQDLSYRCCSRREGQHLCFAQVWKGDAHLDLHCTELAEEYLLHGLSKNESGKEAKVEEDEHAAVAPSKPYSCGVKVGSLAKGTKDDGEGSKARSEAVEGDPLGGDVACHGAGHGDWVGSAVLGSAS